MSITFNKSLLTICIIIACISYCVGDTNTASSTSVLGLIGYNILGIISLIGGCLCRKHERLHDSMDFLRSTVLPTLYFVVAFCVACIDVLYFVK